MKKLIYVLLVFAFLSCSNDNNNKCERWEVQEWIKEGNNTLSDTVTSEKTICNDDIKPAGTTYVYHQSGNVKYYRKMIRKL